MVPYIFFVKSEVGKREAKLIVKSQNIPALKIRRENLIRETKIREISEGNTTERSMRPIFYYFGRGRIMTKIQHPFHTVKIITNDGKFGGTNLIMTEGKLDPEVKILIRKGLIEKGLNKKITGKFYRYNEEDRIKHKEPPLTWNLCVGPGFTIDYSCRTIIVRMDATDETIDTLLSLANGELVVSLFKYPEKETEGMKMILP